MDIGGLSRAEATLKLDKHLSAAGSRKPTVRVADHSGEVDPRQAGLAFDVRQTVDRAAGSRTDPFAVIGGLFRSGGDTEPTVRVDEGKARTALEKLGESLNEKARDRAVTFGNGQVNDVAPHNGYALDVDAAADTLRTAFLSGTADSVTVLRTRETKPKITAAETRRAVREFAQPAMSAPVTLTAGGKRLTISRVVLGEHLKMQPDDSGKLIPNLDGKGLLAAPAVARRLADIIVNAQGARLRLDGDKVVVDTDGKPGQEVTAKALSTAVLPLLTKSGAAARTGEVATTKTQPKVTRENAARLGLREKMSSFTVNFEPAAYRTKNIGRAAQLINGSLVLPNETWSLNQTVGERTEANGFVDGIIIFTLVRGPFDHRRGCQVRLAASPR
ncbi:peptidoglycan binding domain-containing protein [Streptomyces sp. NPDC001982]|uniref:peptidoglycan binding domain-containing protein n=1 Tax=Streptomyces sp. NPDC001982 TaxID=3154405 RepID=UPI00331B11AD